MCIALLRAAGNAGTSGAHGRALRQRRTSCAPAFSGALYGWTPREANGGDSEALARGSSEAVKVFFADAEGPCRNGGNA
jgi:hypothetical protein